MLAWQSLSYREFRDSLKKRTANCENTGSVGVLFSLSFSVRQVWSRFRGLVSPAIVACDSPQDSAALSGRRHEYRGPSAVPRVVMQSHHHNTAMFGNGDFVSRDSDVWVVSSFKSGTTVTQQIIRELLFGSDEHLQALTTVPIPEISPWVAAAYRLWPQHTSRVLDAQSQRRVLKSHEPIEALPFNAKNKHIVLVRDFRDVIWSAHNHYANYYCWVRWMHNSPTRYGKWKLPKLAKDFSAKDFWLQMTSVGDQFGNPDGAWLWSPLWVLGSWMHASRTNAVDGDSVMFVHYMDLCRDPLTEIKRVADFIGVEASSERLLEIKEKSSIEAMRKQKNVLGFGTAFFKEGNATFFKKGGSRREDWQSQLDSSDLDRYRQLAEYYLHKDDIAFMENGSGECK